MQNNSAKICQEQTTKDQKPTLNKPPIAQVQKKNVQKVVKNPLMVKKNPLMKSEVAPIKQVQNKPVIQKVTSPIIEQTKVKQEQVKPLSNQQNISKVQVKEAVVQVKSQKPIEQTTVTTEKQNNQKKIQQTKQPKKELVEHQPKQKKQLPPPVNPPVKKNPLLMSKPKATSVKQPEAKPNVQTESKVKVQAEPKAKVQSEVKVNLQAEAKAKVQPQLKAKLQPQLKPPVQPLIKVQGKAQIKANVSQREEKKEEVIKKDQVKIKVEEKTQTIQKQIIQALPKKENIKQQREQQKQQPQQHQQKIAEVKLEAKPQKTVEQKTPTNKQHKDKQTKVQPEKKTNPLTIKKNPLIKSQMIFKPTQIKNPLIGTPQKTAEQPKEKIENNKIEKKQEKKVQSEQSQNLPKLQKELPQKVEQETKIQQKLTQPSVVTEQSTSNTKFQNRFSFGFFSESKDSEQILKNQVQIKITDSTVKGTGLSKYVVYQISGKDKLGPFYIARKYSQFQAIRKIIRERWPGCFIPSIHNKSELKKVELKQKQIRIVLQNFILGLSYSEHLYYKEEVQLFLRSPQVDILDMVKQMPVLKAKDLINRYTSCFGEQMFQNIVESQLSAKIRNFITILRKIVSSLNFMSQKVQTLSESFDNYVINLARFSQITKSYEQVCLSQYTNHNRECSIIIKDQTNNINKLKDLSKFNPFNKLYSFINNEVRDAQSFLQIIIASQLFALKRDELNKQIKDNQQEITQISLGHKTLKTMTTRKTKQQIQIDLEAQTKKLVEQKDNIVEIYNITEVILAKKEIEFFKTFKRNTYKDVLRQWVAVTRQLNPELQELWKFIQDSSLRALK